MNRKTAQVRRSDGKLTYNRILDAAEKLFSIDGLSGVSLRQITSAAEVDLASIKYYFDSKEGLFDVVLSRRVEGMSKQRLESLREIALVPHSAEVLRQILSLYVAPLYGGSDAEFRELGHYRRLVALVANSRNWQDQIFKQHYDPVAKRFIAAVRTTLPDVDPADISWGFTFFIAAMVNTIADTGRIDRLSDGLCRSSDVKEGLSKLVDYTVGAFCSMSPMMRQLR